MLKLVVEKIEDVEEPFRGLYEAKDGEIRLKVDGVEGLHSALRSERTYRANAEKKVKAFESLGKTDDEIKALISEAEKADDLREAMATRHAKDLKAKDAQVASMKSSLERFLVDAQAAAAIAAAKGSADLLLPHVQKNARVVEQDGEYIVEVVDAKGNARINGKGAPMTIADLVSEMRKSDVYGRAFEGSGQSGSGMRPANANGGGMSQGKTIARSEFERLHPVEQMAKMKGGFTLTE